MAADDQQLRWKEYLGCQKKLRLEKAVPLGFESILLNHLDLLEHNLFEESAEIEVPPGLRMGVPLEPEKVPPRLLIGEK